MATARTPPILPILVRHTKTKKTLTQRMTALESAMDDMRANRDRIGTRLCDHDAKLAQHTDQLDDLRMKECRRSGGHVWDVTEVKLAHNGLPTSVDMECTRCPAWRRNWPPGKLTRRGKRAIRKAMGL